MSSLRQSDHGEGQSRKRSRGVTVHPVPLSGKPSNDTSPASLTDVPEPWRSALGRLEDGILIVTKKERRFEIVDLTDPAVNLLERSREELRGTCLMEILGIIQDSTEGFAFQRAMEQGATYRNEVRYPEKETRCRFFVLDFVLLDQARQGNNCVVILRDVSHRKMFLEMLRESRQHLEESLRSLAQLEKGSLKQERMHALGQLASGIAHDFNNMLSPILGFTELLLSFPDHIADRSKVMSYLEKIRTAAQDSAGVVARLRAFYSSQEEDTRDSLLLLNDLLTEVVSLTTYHWKTLAQARGIHIDIDTHLSPGLYVRGNAGELRQVLTNLVLNSVDALPQGGTITLSCEAAGNEACIRIKDTGEGMTPEVLKSCFDPFFSTKGSRGTGLGMTLVQRIIQQHKGSVHLLSEIGKGTELSILLPIASPTNLVQNSAEATHPPSRPLSLFLIDDDADLLDVVSQMLLSLGHQVRTCSNPEEALRIMLRDPFDAVITDRAMPRLCGDQLAREIRALQPHLPVVLLTGFADEIPTGEMADSPYACILAKPVSLQQLREALEATVPSGLRIGPWPLAV